MAASGVQPTSESAKAQPQKGTFDPVTELTVAETLVANDVHLRQKESSDIKSVDERCGPEASFEREKKKVPYIFTYSSTVQSVMGYRFASFPTSIASRLTPALLKADDEKASAMAFASRVAAVMLRSRRLTPHTTSVPVINRS